jgi:secreted trypsin-like serine protease
VIAAKDVHRYPLGGPSILGGRGDIAVIELTEPSTQQPIEWATPEDESLFAAGVLSTVIGWGATRPDGGDNPVDWLREAEVPIVSDDSCRASYSDPQTPYGVLFHGEVELCAGYPEGGVDTCAGDSGGPLMVPKPSGGWLLAGITSWGAAPCAQPSKPGVYAEVAAFATFIELFE